jgi:hypothetical protein
METVKEDNNFYPNMKVFLSGEYGVVTNDFWDLNQIKIYGVIRWDTKEDDFEDWRGLFGSFKDMGGNEVTSDYKFKFINDDGTPI